jgi:hypothetical protein
MADIVWIEHGTMAIASVGNEPLASDAPMSSIGCHLCAKDLISGTFRPVSR